MTTSRIAAAVALALSAAAPALAQDAGRIDVATWMAAYDEIGRSGRSVTWLHDQEVHGADGNVIGGIDGVIIGADGEIEALAVETGSFVGVGGVPVRVPWERIELTDGGRIVAAIAEENLPGFELFGDGPVAGPRAFRADELIGAHVRLEDEKDYGYVADLIFNREGEITAVVVSPSYGYGEHQGYAHGYYAYPFYGYGFTTGSGYYDLPYTTDEVAALPPFEYATVGATDPEGVGAAGEGIEPERERSGRVEAD